MVRGFLALLVLTAVPAVRADDPPAADPARALERQMRRVIDAAEPSVVAVVVSHHRYPGGTVPAAAGRLGKYAPAAMPARAFGQAAPPDRLDPSDPQNVADFLCGSAVVLDERGLVLTNYHLIDGATKVYVRTAAGTGSFADVHAADARSDLAVLRLIDPVAGLKAARFADVRLGDRATVGRGTFVVAVGHAQAAGVADGVPGASWGILSNVHRRVPGPGREERRTKALYHYGSLLQTDARLTLGCSGGGLFNLDGELVGLTTPMAAVAGADTAGGFAVPFDANYRRIVDALKAGREVEYGFLGVTLGPERPGFERFGLPDKGVQFDVTANTPAALAGLRASDTLLAIDGNRVRDQDDLFLYVGAALAGSRVKLTVRRDGVERDLPVTLAKFAHDMPWLASVRPPAVFGLRVEYTSVLLIQNAGGRDRTPALPLGVLVRDLDPGSPAARRFKDLGDPRGAWIVTHVNGRPVPTPPDFYREAGGRDAVTLRVVDPAGQDGPRDVRLP